MRRWAILAAAVFVAAGCVQSETAIVGGKVREKNYTSVVSLSPSTTELYSRVGLIKYFKGWTSSDNYPLGWSRSVDVVVDGTTPDFEKIVNYNVDLVLYDVDLYGDDVVQKLNDIGCELMPMEIRTIDQLEVFLYKLAAKTGGESDASAYIDEIYAAREKSLSSMGDLEFPTVAVLIGDPGAQYMAVGTGSFLAEVVGASGGKLVGPDSVRFETVSYEQLINLNPEVIITTMGTGERILADEKLAPIEAQIERRVYDVDGDVLLRTGSRVHTLIEGLNQAFVPAGKDRS
jgi:ABC-type Fe3+-hydroxamate transport system substrate-binding protein